MEFGLQPGTILAIAIAPFLALHVLLRAPLPLSFIVVAAAAAFIGDFGVPFRHLVEGGFGFINLVLALFAGAFFGHMMRGSGAADAAAAPAPPAGGASGSARESSLTGGSPSLDTCSYLNAGRQEATGHSMTFTGL